MLFMEFSHKPVLLSACIDVLFAKILPPRCIFVDCTAGGGGHSYAIAEKLPEGGRLISLDRDDAALDTCRNRLGRFGDKVTVFKSNFADLSAALDSLGIEQIDGIMWDLGVSSYQLDEASRGFSYTSEAYLDMRMDTSGGQTAADVVNGYPESELARIIRDYGEERFASRIARTICEERERVPVTSTTQLADLVIRSIPAAARAKENQHPARRTFQAIRIEVNGELSAIEPSIRAAVERLRPGGRAAVITFHSLEDRIVKQTFASLSSGCTCPPSFPVCVCGKKPIVSLVNKKPILPTAEEIEENPRAHSAKLRAAEKL